MAGKDCETEKCEDATADLAIGVLTGMTNLLILIHMIFLVDDEILLLSMDYAWSLWYAPHPSTLSTPTDRPPRIHLDVYLFEHFTTNR